MRHGLVTVLLVAAGVFVASTGTVGAARPASDDEKELILDVFDSSIERDRWQCWDVAVSTVNERWAAVQSATVSLDPDEQLEACPETSNGYAIFKFELGGWGAATSSDGSSVCAAIGMPAAVGRDLGEPGYPVCQPASRSVFAIDVYKLRVRPRTLIQGPHGAFEDLHWKSWGDRKAFGRGWLVYSDAYRPRAVRARVRIVLSGSGLCGRKRVYFKRRVEVVHAADRGWTRHLTGTVTSECP